MQINVSKQLKSPIGSVRNYKVSEAIDIDGDGRDGIVEGNIRLTRTDHSILAQGTLYLGIETTCSRCLGPFNYKQILNIEEEYLPDTYTSHATQQHSAGELSFFTIDEYHTLDLTEAIRQYSLLAIPIKPLCHKQCNGLCPYCGHNLNHGPCSCSPR
jgi:uncharacterized protein